MNLKTIFINISNRIIDFFLPHVCPGCSTILPHAQVICANCWQKIHFITEPFCQYCGSPLEYELYTRPICNRCLCHPPKYDCGRALMVYDQATKEIIHRFKYLGQTFLKDNFNRLILTTQAEFFKDVDYLIPVPLHPKRLQMRHYNQALLLAQEISHLFSIPVLENILFKVINTAPQATLSGKKRFTNLLNAFQINPQLASLLRHKTVTLIDDVTTTGTTLNSCASVLKRHTAVKIVKAFTLTHACKPYHGSYL